MKKIISVFAVFIAGLLLLAPMALAAEFIAPEKDSDNSTLTLSSTETHHNAYVAGKNVFINSATTGDLYAVGGSITIEGPIEQDLVVAGGNVTINGPVGGDVRVLGGTVIINNKIGGDLVMLSGNLNLTDAASVGGDVFVGGGQLVFNGAVAGNMKVSAGQVTINNYVKGDADLMIERDLTFGSKAVVPGKINYTGTKEAVIKDGAQISAINFQAVPGHRGGHARNILLTVLTIATVLKILSIIIFGLIIIKLYPRTTNDLVQTLDKKPWYNLGIGFLALVLVPILCLILLVTVLGAYIAIMGFLVWMILFLLSSLIVCIYTGAWLFRMFGKTTELVVNWQALTVGTIVIIIISFLPIIGLLIFFIVAMMAFGAILTHAHGHVKSEHTTSI